ncbi:hypothetical protein VNO78_28833 [Psophocarpus tetragonolobus]|uniref:Uncharacterized protein n=1 Tax=Psophocarpus tetragonolobus TaxID=3891 RepID=A0AAN9RTW2_PSOTE
MSIIHEALRNVVLYNFGTFVVCLLAVRSSQETENNEFYQETSCHKCQFLCRFLFFIPGDTAETLPQVKTLSCTSISRNVKELESQAAIKKARLIPPWEQALSATLYNPIHVVKMMLHITKTYMVSSIQSTSIEYNNN